EMALGMLQERGERGDTMLVISAFRYCPFGMSGVQTIGYELAEQLPGPIDHVFCCAGGGGLTLAVARGFLRLREAGRLKGTLPRGGGVQPEGDPPLARPLRRGRGRAQAGARPTTLRRLPAPRPPPP